MNKEKPVVVQIERRQAERARRRLDELFRALIENSSDVIMIVDADAVIRYQSPSIERLLDYKPAELIGTSVTDLLHPKDVPKVHKLIKEAISQGGTPDISSALEVNLHHRNGSWRVWESIARALPGDLMTMGVVINSWDITKRKRAEQQGEHYASQLQGLAQASLRVHSTLSLEELLEFLNKEARRIIGAHESVVSLTANDNWGQTIIHASLSDKYASWRDFNETLDGSGIYRLVCQTNRPMRMTQSELEAHPAWHGFGKAAGKHPPLCGWLAAPLTAGDGRNIGLLMLSDKYEGDFSANDEAILVQLAEMGSVALENARLYKQVESGHRQMKRLSQQVISAHEEERRLLAHELHDNTGQALIALKISLELMAADLSGDYTGKSRRVLEAISITDSVMEQIRSLAHDLRPPSLDAVGLNAAIEGLCRNFARQTQLTIDYAGAVLPPLEGTLNIMLYRVLQEALTNVAKHASAKRVQVALGLEDDTVRLSVEDDGCGFEDLAGVVEGGQCKGMGLLGMRERVELLGGSLEIESHPGSGTRLVVKTGVRSSESKICLSG